MPPDPDEIAAWENEPAATEPDPHEGVPEFEPDPEHVDDDSEPLPNPPDPKTGKRE